MILLNGLAISGYRSFPSADLAWFSPLLDVNFIVGQNNAGKSNLLRFIHAVFTRGPGADDTETVSAWDRPLGDPEHAFRFAVAVPIGELAGDPRAMRFNSDYWQEWVQLLRSNTMTNGDTVPWRFISDSLVPAAQWRLDPDFVREIASAATERAHVISQVMSSGTLGISGGEYIADFIRILEFISPNLSELPDVRTIVAFRQVTTDNANETNSLNGRNLIRQLRALQNPALEHREDREKFRAITAFAQAVLDDDSVTIDIPHDLSSILITRGGATLPLENLGTGVHEVMIIAAAATLIENAIVCIEEPEIHLHPILQRKLVAYLARSTSNQYFIATHSAHMLDSEIGSIFHITLESGASRVAYAGMPKDRAAVVADLGYTPSDLVQANSIIWVEGPSDRIYIRHWIWLLAPDLIEGTHFSIMFYGGRLLSHLSPNDSEVEDFISLRRMNRHMAIVIDSDKAKPQSKINATKTRVRDNFKKDGPGYAWVTAGYTIENYVPAEIWSAAVKATHPSAKATSPGKWDNPLDKKALGITADKVKVARAVVDLWVEGSEWPHDSKLKVLGLIDLVRSAN